MRKLTVESGRSMVEMLGVLAIIGVLSVGGIAGYKTAMNRHQANQFMDLWHKANVERLAQMTANPKKVDVEFEQNGIRVAYKSLNEPAYKQYIQSEMDFTTMNADVCKMIDDMTKDLDLFGVPKDGNTLSMCTVDGTHYSIGANVFSECQEHSGSFTYQIFYDWYTL